MRVIQLLKYDAHQIGQSILGLILDCPNVKDYLNAIEEQFETSNTSLASALMGRLSSMKHNDTIGMHEQIMKMRDIATQLMTLEIEIFESFLVHLIRNSLPSEYGPFQIAYNT